jgi:hypothetical protein
MNKLFKDALTRVKAQMESMEDSEFNVYEFKEMLEHNALDTTSVVYDGGFYERTYVAINCLSIDKYLAETLTKSFDRQENEEILIWRLDDLNKNRVKHLVRKMWHIELSGLAAPIGRIVHITDAGIAYIDMSDNIYYRKELWLASIENVLNSNNEFNKTKYIKAIEWYESQRKIAIRALEALQTPVGGQKRGLAEYLDKRPGYLIQLDAKQQLENAYNAMGSNGLAARTWGFEVEIADAKGVEPTFGIEKGEDGSLRSYESNDDCDCDCEDCTYHDCDCDYCENQNSDPEHCNNSHCSSADMAEFRSVRGINRVKHAGLKKLCEALEYEDAEVNDTCGVHIHVFAADLEPKQIAHLLAAYKWVDRVIQPLAGREDTSYARSLFVKDIVTALKEQKFNMNKQSAINVGHFNGDRGTVEFRQMLGNYDFKRITLWAWLVRGLVEVAKRGAKMNDYIAVTSLQGIIEVFAKFNYYLHDEQPDMLIPGGMRDNQHIKKHHLERSNF